MIFFHYTEVKSLLGSNLISFVAEAKPMIENIWRVLDPSGSWGRPGRPGNSDYVLRKFHKHRVDYLDRCTCM